MQVSRTEDSATLPTRMVREAQATVGGGTQWRRRLVRRWWTLSFFSSDVSRASYVVDPGPCRQAGEGAAGTVCVHMKEAGHHGVDATMD